LISSGIGRYGPFLLHDGSYANLETVEDVFSIGLNRAVTVIADKASKAPGGRAAAAALKELGDHPDGGAITVRDGKYGPYVNWGKVNATLPKGTDPQALTAEEALVLIAAKAGKGTAAKGKAKPKAKAATAASKTPKTAAKPKAAKAKTPAKAKKSKE
jgi:DNA topoisomerase-1